MMTDIGEVAAVEVQPNIELENSDVNVNFSEVSAKLAEGLMAIYQSPLEQIKKELSELTMKQETLITQMQIENEKLQLVQRSERLNELFSTIKIYQTKLSNVKKEMISIHDRTGKLKRRALRLQQLKQKEALHKEQQREQEIRREQELIGKPANS